MRDSGPSPSPHAVGPNRLPQLTRPRKSAGSDSCAFRSAPTFGERPVLKLMYAAVIRAADRWRGLTVGEFEQPWDLTGRGASLIDK